MRNVSYLPPSVTRYHTTVEHIDDCFVCNSAKAWPSAKTFLSNLFAQVSGRVSNVESSSNASTTQIILSALELNLAKNSKTRRKFQCTLYTGAVGLIFHFVRF